MISAQESGSESPLETNTYSRGKLSPRGSFEKLSRTNLTSESTVRMVRIKFVLTVLWIRRQIRDRRLKGGGDQDKTNVPMHAQGQGVTGQDLKASDPGLRRCVRRPSKMNQSQTLMY